MSAPKQAPGEPKDTSFAAFLRSSNASDLQHRYSGVLEQLVSITYLSGRTQHETLGALETLLEGEFEARRRAFQEWIAGIRGEAGIAPARDTDREMDR